MAVAARESPGRLSAWGVLVGLVVAGNFAGRYSGEGIPEDPLYRWSAAIGAAVQYGLMLSFVLAVAWWGGGRVPLGVRRPTSWRLALGIGLVLVVLLTIVAAIVGRFFDPGEEQGILPSGWDPSHAAPFAANFAAVALVAPIVEELTFRGLGFSLLIRFGQVAAIVLIGVAFSLAHGVLEGLPILFVFGAGLAYMRARTESVIPGILFHAFFNALQILIAVEFFRAEA